jgi:hypothetical protein
MYASYDYSMWPLVIVRVADVDPTPEDFQAHLDEFGKLLKRGGCFRVLFDITAARAIPIEYLKKQVAFLKEHKEHIADNLLCSGIVVTNLAVRGLLSLLFTFYKLTKPNRVFKTTTEAIEWITTVSPDGKTKLFFED